MADLSPKKRAAIPKKDFGLPEKAKTPDEKKESGNYPIPDKKHAISAKGRAKAQLKAGNLTKTEYEKVITKADKKLKETTSKGQAKKKSS